MQKLREYIFYSFVGLFLFTITMFLSMVEATWRLMAWHELVIIVWVILSPLLLSVLSYVSWKDKIEISYLENQVDKLDKELDKLKKSTLSQ